MVLKSSRSRKTTASRALLAPCARDRMAHALAEQRAVGEAGHRVVERLVGELLLERLALADVAAVEHDAADVLVVEQVRVQDLELADVPSRCRSEHSRTCGSPPANAAPSASSCMSRLLSPGRRGGRTARPSTSSGP